MSITVKSHSKAWILEFLLVREMLKPNSSPLYQYHVTDDEYATLTSMLRDHVQEYKSPVFESYWAAMFCLFVAEKYRREYDGSGLGWEWSGFEQPLSITLPVQRRGGVVMKGLEFWKRPVRVRTNGHDYLGSLFDEGGLPWRMIQSETHGFGRAVRGAINNYYKVKQSGGNIASVISSYEQLFPQSFRTSEKYFLIAAIVEWLMGLVENNPIAELEKPADYLDEHVADWRKLSPLPVGEENARRLINEWLIDAGKIRKERKRLDAEVRNYTCDHWFKGSYTHWSLETEVFLPAEITIEVEGQSIKSTRLEIAFYEGDALLERSGILYGNVNDERTQVSVSIHARVVKVIRNRPDLPLTVHFLSNGQRIHAAYFEGSQVDFHNLPLVFVEVADHLKLHTTVSALIPAESAIIRVPAELMLVANRADILLDQDRHGGRWVEITEDAVCSNADTRVLLTFGPNAKNLKPALNGKMALYNTLPNLTYRGWPRVQSDAGITSPTFSAYANGQPIANAQQRTNAGAFNLIVAGDAGETLLRRRIGVIPPDLKITSIPQSRRSLAKIICRSESNLSVSVDDPILMVEVEQREGVQVISLKPKLNKKTPERVNLYIRDGNVPGDPVVLRLPYPKVGAQIFDEQGKEITWQTISLSQLIETSIILTPREGTKGNFFITLELVCSHVPNFRRHYPYTVCGLPERVSLFALQEDIQQMLGATANQDAKVRIRVETESLLRQIDVVRYEAYVDNLDAQGCFEIKGEFSSVEVSRTKVIGMRVDDPGASPVEVLERCSQGVGVGLFEIPQRMMKNGPWMLLPAKDSGTKFRPKIWIPDSQQDINVEHCHTLHSAAKSFHPILNPEAFAEVIQQMAGDWTHSGWDYLRVLKEEYGYLPLSAFESWLALAHNEKALAAAVFRLELDSLFCRRISNELAVIWETVTVNGWIVARNLHQAFLAQQGVSENFINTLIADRIENLAPSIPFLQHFGVYLKKSGQENLRQMPLIDFSRSWYQDLRRNHADDDQWPEWLSEEMSYWISQQDLPADIKNLPEKPNTRAVAYFPFFMAFMTAGLANINTLGNSPPEFRFAARVLSDFDRSGWYEPIYALVLSGLLLNSDEVCA